MREVAVVSFAQHPNGQFETRNAIEILYPAITEAMERSGVRREDIGFTVSGSCDFMNGQAFSFTRALDAAGAWPPISESHVEMDGAWALYEAWILLQEGKIDAALVYGFGKSTAGSLRDIMALQVDPYFDAPLWPDAISLAGLQARALIDAGRITERDMAEVAARSRRDARDNPNAQLAGDDDPEELLKAPYVVEPLRRHDCPPVTDGAAAVVLAAGDLARKVCERPAWIRGIDTRIETHLFGGRDLTRSVSTEQAAERAGVAKGPVDVAEIHAPFSHQEPVLLEALGIGGNGTRINPSGGALAANPMMSAGLIRIGEAANRIIAGDADRAVAHATSGSCLQQNLVCVLEGGSGGRQ